MEHLHTKTNTTYQIGHLFDDEGKAFDIIVITNWTKDFDPDDEPWISIIDFYFGDYDKESTDHYIDQFLDRQKQIVNSLKYLERLKLIDPTVTDIDNTISCLKSMLVKLH